ncbi:hypothetical protein ScPMuIL_009920 [Solemya velum]
MLSSGRQRGESSTDSQSPHVTQCSTQTGDKAISRHSVQYTTWRQKKKYLFHWSTYYYGAMTVEWREHRSHVQKARQREGCHTPLTEVADGLVSWLFPVTCNHRL